MQVEPGELPANMLGDAWHQAGRSFRLPLLRIVNGSYELDPQGAKVLYKGRLLSTPFAMLPGDTARIGQARLRIAGSLFIKPNGYPIRVGKESLGAHESIVELRPGEIAYLGSGEAGVLLAAENWVEATVAVRNAFGNTTRRKVRAILRVNPAYNAPGELPNVAAGAVLQGEAG